MKRPLNEKARAAADYFTQMQELWDVFVKPCPWYRRARSVDEIGELARALVLARAQLWSAVYEQYPEANGAVGWTVRGGALHSPDDFKAVESLEATR